MSIDKRQFERKDIQAQSGVSKHYNFLDDYTANISIGGCFLSTQQSFQWVRRLSWH